MQAGGLRGAGLNTMLQDLVCCSQLSFDGAASSSATVHHISPPPSRSDFARRPGSALKKTSPASSSSSEDRKRGAAKVKRWKAGEGVLDHSESGKIWPGSAEGFFKGQRAPVRMILSTGSAHLGSSSPSWLGHRGTHGGLDEVLFLIPPAPVLCMPYLHAHASRCRARAFPYVLTCCCVDGPALSYMC